MEFISVEKSSTFANLQTKIKKHSALVGVVGLGYVGLPFAVEKAKVGYSVIGIEQNLQRADQVNAAKNYISDVNSEELKIVVGSGKLKAVTNYNLVPQMDAIIICVPTPLTKNLTPNLSYIESVTRELAQYLRSG
ncbi:MAG: UDP-N-acetyl-D-glucosamine dehydrogenase, partial [Pseudanabaena sp.]